MREYEGFVDKCYDEDKDLVKEMKREIAGIIDHYKICDCDLDQQVKKIMDLIWETRYEW